MFYLKANIINIDTCQIPLGYLVSETEINMNLFQGRTISKPMECWSNV